ncbi:flavin reductase family protein [uncultured Friedmanniella sp.]|uniref:flavin reductase family protein n=1 Tax=uncultured Friedmanniella sp. TaxID=335381 RepID=UPI0035CB1588
MTTELTRPDLDLLGPELDGVAPATFKAVFRRHPAGVAVITFAGPERLGGFTATSVISVSADPPLLTFSVDSASSSWAALREVDTLVVNFLAADQVEVSTRFATSGIDRFAAGGWTVLPSGEPVLDGSPAWFRGQVVQRTPVGRSFLVSVLALDSALAADAERAPLVYHDRSYHAVGDHSAL